MSENYATNPNNLIIKNNKIMKKFYKIIRTEDLLKMQLNGTLNEKQTDLLKRRLDLEIELNKADNYRKFFKKQCVAYNCQNSLPDIGKTNWEHYKEKGNFCGSCYTRINKQKKPKPMSEIVKKNLLKMFSLN